MTNNKLTLLALLGSLAIAGAAYASDLPVRMPVKAPPPPMPVIYNWSGFYVGATVGGSFGNQDASMIDRISGATAGSGTADLNGVVAGPEIGYNWQIHQWVFGIEADFQGSSEKGDGTVNVTAPVASTLSYTARLRYVGTVRGRIGYAFDRFLPYVTGGWAYGLGRIEASTTQPQIANTSFNDNHSYSGWALGAGIEWAFNDNWSAKLEYLYVDLGSGNTVWANALYNMSEDSLTDNIVRVGLNYRF